MREIDEEEFNSRLVEAEHRQLPYRGSALAMQGILDTIQTLEGFLINPEVCIYNDGDSIHILISEQSIQETSESPYLSMIEGIINCFEDGHERNGWEWRSPESISRETGYELNDVQSMLNDNDELFTPSENGRKYRYVNL